MTRDITLAVSVTRSWNIEAWKHVIKLIHELD